LNWLNLNGVPVQPATCFWRWCSAPAIVGSKKPHLSDSLLQVMGQLIWAWLATKKRIMSRNYALVAHICSLHLVWSFWVVKSNPVVVYIHRNGC
jgi:hypothetical protein